MLFKNYVLVECIKDFKKDLSSSNVSNGRERIKVTISVRTKDFGRVHALHLNFPMQAFLLVEDFSKSCYILGSHRVLKRKHQHCNDLDLVIKVLHWKCGGFIAFLLYAS